MASTHDLTPNGATETTNWTANHHLAVDDPPGSPDDASTAANSTNTSATCRMRDSLTAMANLSQVNRITLHTRIKGQSGQGAGVQAIPFIYVNSTRYYGATVTGPEQSVYSDHADEWIDNPNTGEPWTKADLDALEAGLEYIPTSDADDAVFITQLYVRVEFVAAPVRLEAARFMASAELNLFRRTHAIVEVPAPERYADVPILGDIDLVHLALPTTEASYGREPWQRHRAIKLGEKVDLNNPASPLVLRLLLTRHVRVAEWDTMETEKAPSTFMDGVARLSSGAGRSFSRASKLYVDNPAAAAQGSSQVVELQNDQEGLCAGGTLLEAAGTNECIRSSFIGGVETGWTSAGEGSNGSAIALSDEQLLFDTQITEDVLKFTAGNPIHVADLQATGTATAAWADGTVGCASFDVYDLSAAAPLYYQVIRDVGGTPNYWRDSDSTWQAGATWNAMAGQVAWHRHATKPMNIGTNTPDATLQLRVGIPTATGVAGQINYLAHAQLEKNPYPTSRIPTVAATVTRALADLRIANDHGKRVYTGEPDEPVTAFLEFMAEWNSSDLATGDREMFRVYWDATNFIRLFYSLPNSRWTYRHQVAGVNYSTNLGVAVVRGVWNKLAVRVISTAGEYDLAPYTLSLWVDGVKATNEGVAVAFGSLPSAATLYVGQTHAQASHADGIIRRRRTVFAALSDQEIVGEMEA